MADRDAHDPPRVGLPLPAADHAVIDSTKLRQYVLNQDHPVGRHKANVFRMALDIKLDDWEYLRDCIFEQLPHMPVTDVRQPRSEAEGHTWEVLVPIVGLGAKAERILTVITAWEIVEGHPALVTARVAPSNRQQDSSAG